MESAERHTPAAGALAVVGVRPTAEWCAAGSDSAAGSAADPWQSYDAARTAFGTLGPGDEHAAVSNAIHYAGTSSSFDCFELGLPLAAYSAIDHNLCHAPAAPGAEWADGYGSLAAWVAASGFDLSSSTDDPGFADPQGGDLSAASADAAMVDRGHPSLSSPFEIGGFPRDQAPDVGAHEWGVDGVFRDGFETGTTAEWSVTVP